MIIRVLTLLLILISAFQILAQSERPVRVEVLAVKPCIGCGPRPTYDTSLTFRVTNTTKTSLKVCGTNFSHLKKYAAENNITLDPMPFRPVFLQVNRAKTSSDWKYPTNDGKRPEWKDFAAANGDSFLLMPGESLEFDNIMSAELEADRPFKLALFVLVGNDPEPRIVLSEELRFVTDGAVFDREASRFWYRSSRRSVC
jgi:hypothetical protein